MGNCCFPRKNNELFASLINSDSYELNTRSQIYENNIKEVNDRIFSIEEKCGTLFKKFSDDIGYLHQKILDLEEINNELKKKIENKDFNS